MGPTQLKAGLDTNHTLQMLGAQGWWPRVAKMCDDLSHATNLPTNVNVYITPPGQDTSLAPHNDFTCNFMVHVAGNKRWRLWKDPDFWLPIDQRFIYGRDEAEPLSAEELGEPYMDVILEPGG